MTNRKQFQFFPFHLVDMSPWPLLTSFSVLLMAVSAVMCFHGFANGGKLLLLGFILTASVMLLWFKDVVTEGRVKNFNLISSLNSKTKLYIISFYLCINKSIICLNSLNNLSIFLLSSMYFVKININIAYSLHNAVKLIIVSFLQENIDFISVLYSTVTKSKLDPKIVLNNVDTSNDILIYLLIN